MSSVPRSQGRPARGDGEVGRTRLLERTRDALKSKPRIDLQRREIAIVAGVTPALVSYYYPDKWDLFAAAAKPVIESYIAELVAILRSVAVPRLKVLSLTYLFIDFNLQQGYLLDFYLENSEKMARKEDLKALHAAYAEVKSFFGGLLQDGLLKGDSAAFVQSSLWALCKYVAQQPHLAPLADSPDRDRALRLQAEAVCALFLSGVATPQFFQAASAEPARARFNSVA